MGEKPNDGQAGDPALDDFESRLRSARQRRAHADEPGGRPSGLGQAIRIALEMVSAVLVGGGIGWYLDRWLDTKPWCLLAFLVLGGAAGILNAYRAATRMTKVDD
jgi:ATP synthase protein I